MWWIDLVNTTLCLLIFHWRRHSGKSTAVENINNVLSVFMWLQQSHSLSWPLACSLACSDWLRCQRHKAPGWVREWSWCQHMEQLFPDQRSLCNKCRASKASDPGLQSWSMWSLRCWEGYRGKKNRRIRLACYLSNATCKTRLLFLFCTLVFIGTNISEGADTAYCSHV